MLARATSDAGTRLRRSKSASTVHWHSPASLEPVDPDVSQRHALAAATAAYARAQEHGKSDRSSKRSSELSRTKSSSSRKSLATQGSHFPPRDSSIRSTRPPRGGQVSGPHSLTQAPASTTEKFPSFHLTPGSVRPLSAQCSVGTNENVRPNSQAKSHRPNGTSSATSQQIRKARSMYYASSVQTGSPIARPPAKYLTTPPPMTVTLAPEPAPASHRFPAPVPSPPASLPQLPAIVHAGDTINKARDQYLQGFRQRQVIHKPSLFLAPFKKRQNRTKTERPRSAGIHSVSSESRQTPNESGLEFLDDFGMPKQKEKRSFSNSIKDKLRKVFRRTSNHATTLPVQQIEASRDYFNYKPMLSEQTPATGRSPEIPSPDDETLSRARSRTSNERPPSPLARPLSRGSNKSRESNRSLHSENNTIHQSSRVTSWSDSSVGGTLTQRNLKRLTVIHEAKDSIGSETERSMAACSAKRKSVPFSGLVSFRDPMPIENLVEGASTPVDPKRVFSALMKEIDTTKATNVLTGAPYPSPSTTSDVFESSATKEMHPIAPVELRSSAGRNFRTSTSSDRVSSHKRPNTAQSKASSVKSLGRALKSTIRTVTPNGQQSSMSPDFRRSVRGAVRVPKADLIDSSESAGSESSLQSVSRHTSDATVLKMGARSRSSTADSQVSNFKTPTAEQIKRRVERSQDRWKSPLEATRAPTFPHPQETRYSPTDIAYQNYAPSLPTVERSSPKEGRATERQATPIPASPGSPPQGPLFSPLSPSVYSRDTDGLSILPNESVASLNGVNEDEAPNESGSAVIITSHAVKSYVIGTPTHQRVTDSTRSSRDWKAWLSHEVSELENTLEGNIAIDTAYVLAGGRHSPSTRHCREYTQIEQDEPSPTSLQMSIDMPTPRPEIKQDTLSKHPGGEDENTFAYSQITAVSSSPVPEDRREDSSRESNTSSSPNALPVAQTERLSSVHDQLSRTPQSIVNTPKSRMNDRFPFLDTGKRSNGSTSRLRRTSQTPITNSPGSSSLVSKATSSPKTYSDFSGSGANRTSQYVPDIQFRRNEEVIQRKDIRKENLSPKLAQPRILHKSHSGTALSVSARSMRPNSVLVLSSTDPNYTPKTVAKYTTTTTTRDVPQMKKTFYQGQADSLPWPHYRWNIPSTRRRKSSSRPKSAFDLRNLDALPDACYPCEPQVSRAEKTPRKPEPYIGQLRDYVSSQRGSTLDCANRIDAGAPCMLLEPSWVTLSPEHPLQSSLDSREQVYIKPKLHLKASSSTLALSKEPSPGAEELNIDAVIGEQSMSVKGGDEEISTGRITPGQRMAERFLKERSATRGSGAGSPISVVGAAERLKRENTPAFL